MQVLATDFNRLNQAPKHFVMHDTHQAFGSCIIKHPNRENLFQKLPITNLHMALDAWYSDYTASFLIAFSG